VSSIRSILKKVIPDTIADKLLIVEQSVRYSNVFSRDKRHFKQHYSRASIGASMAQLDARLIYFAHSLEKGMSRDKIRFGFGTRALMGLAKAMKSYGAQGYDKKSKAYVNALSSLHEYIRIHDEAHASTAHLNSLFPETILEEVKHCKSTIAGVERVTGTSKAHNSDKNFKDIFMDRYSVRSFSSKPVSTERLKDAIEISMKSPSICNRQPARVHVGMKLLRRYLWSRLTRIVSSPLLKEINCTLMEDYFRWRYCWP
jgi:hypothetical protein